MYIETLALTKNGIELTQQSSSYFNGFITNLVTKILDDTCHMKKVLSPKAKSISEKDVMNFLKIVFPHPHSRDIMYEIHSNLQEHLSSRLSIARIKTLPLYKQIKDIVKGIHIPHCKVNKPSILVAMVIIVDNLFDRFSDDVKYGGHVKFNSQGFSHQYREDSLYRWLQK